ncbi:ATP-binding protein [Shimia sp. MIT1388]|uniref:ATP-binding protein n=1 Tax=Shimia sp. MIT1388 TaxID=3096992 RepID=UPI00399C28E1
MNTSVASRIDPKPADDGLLTDLGLVDAEFESAFDNLTCLTRTVMNVPVAMVSIVQPSRDRQYFKSHLGLPEPWATARQTPLSHSFCQHVRASDQPLVVANAREHPVLKHNGAVDALNIIAYLGMPISLPDGTCIGALCAIDDTPRDWSREEQQKLHQLALCVNEQIALKHALRAAEIAKSEAEEAARAREDFLAHMAHEIRTPLNGIIGSMDLLSAELEDAPLGDAIPELLQTMDSSTQGLLRTLNDSLDLSKIDAGKLDLEKRPFDLRAAVVDVIALHRASAECKGVKLVVEASDTENGAPRLGDEFRLRQVLGNLLSNAVKFTDSGTIHVSLEAKPDTISATVTDSGCGMSAEQLSEVFSAYAQADTTVARRKGGTGLGLPIVQRLITLMQGQIEVDSAPGKGTTFTTWVPMPVAHEVNEKDLRHAKMANAFAGQRTLVADDSPVNRMVLSRMLESMGAEVVCVSNGNAALQAALSETFDALFIDIRMPDMTGDQIARTLRARDDDAAQPRMVAVTANVFPEHIASYLDAGFDHCLAKPIRRADLCALTTR